MCLWLEKLVSNLGLDYPEDHPIPLTTILESNGWRDAVWALRATRGIDEQIRLFACDCAALILPQFKKQYPADERPNQALKVARRRVEGLAILEEIQIARAAHTAHTARAAALAAREAAKGFADDKTFDETFDYDIASLFRKHFTT